MYNVALLQPCNSVFELIIGGLHIKYQHPQHPVAMRVVLLSDSGVGNWSANLYDQTGFEVEPYIWAARDNDGKGLCTGQLRFGYTASNRGGVEPRMSRWYNVILDSYSVDVRHTGFEIQCKGQVTFATQILSSNQYNGTYRECLDRFTAIHGYDIVEIPPVDAMSLRELDSTGKTTEYRDKIFSKTLEENDHLFITRMVTQATKTPDGKSGYRVSFMTGPTGRDTMYIVIPEQAGSIGTYSYDVQSKASVVIDWKPEVNFSTMTSILDKDNVVVNGTQAFTGRTQKQYLNQQLTAPFQSNLDGNDINQNLEADPPEAEPKQMLYHDQETMPPNVTSRGIRVRRGTTGNNTTDLTTSLSRLLTMAMAGQKATLIILGDPEIVACTHCSVNFRYPNSPMNAASIPPLHYTSGKYFVEEVTHEIIGGRYTTELRMIRPSGTSPTLEPKQ